MQITAKKEYEILATKFKNAVNNTHEDFENVPSDC